MVEAVDTYQGYEFPRFKTPSWSTSIKDLGLVGAVDRFSEGVVVRAVDTPGGQLNVCFRRCSEYLMGTYETSLSE